MTTLERLSAALADRYRIERELGAGGMDTADGFLYYVMPFIQGETLGVDEAVRIAREVADALKLCALTARGEEK